MLSYKTPAQLRAENEEGQRTASRNLAERGTGSDAHLSPQQQKDFRDALATRKAG